MAFDDEVPKPRTPVALNGPVSVAVSPACPTGRGIAGPVKVRFPSKKKLGRVTPRIVPLPLLTRFGLGTAVMFSVLPGQPVKAQTLPGQLTVSIVRLTSNWSVTRWA